MTTPNLPLPRDPVYGALWTGDLEASAAGPAADPKDGTP